MLKNILLLLICTENLSNGITAVPVHSKVPTTHTNGAAAAAAQHVEAGEDVREASTTDEGGPATDTTDERAPAGADVGAATKQPILKDNRHDRHLRQHSV